MPNLPATVFKQVMMKGTSMKTRPEYIKLKDFCKVAGYSKNELKDLTNERKIPVYYRCQKAKVLVALADLLEHIQANQGKWHTSVISGITKNGKPVTDLIYKSGDIALTIVGGSLIDGEFVLNNDNEEYSSIFPVEIECSGTFYLHPGWTSGGEPTITTHDSKPLSLSINKHEFDEKSVYLRAVDMESLTKNKQLETEKAPVQMEENQGDDVRYKSLAGYLFMALFAALEANSQREVMLFLEETYKGHNNGMSKRNLERLLGQAVDLARNRNPDAPIPIGFFKE